ncbi:MAG: helix-turn-helix transcriptional regulator [Bacteroidota bacterium]
MSNRSQNSRIIFGLKVKQLRQERGLSFAVLAKQTGMSVSYLNEIEKGKKYPREDKIEVLAKALEVSTEELMSTELRRNLAPVGELLKSNFLNELPLDLFGIELHKVVEIIANAPMRVGAFVSTLVELVRNYSLREEHFYHGALRAYQEMNYNYFEEIEEAAAEFVTRHNWPKDGAVALDLPRQVLAEEFQYKIVEDGLKDYPDLQELHSVYLPKHRKLLLNDKSSDTQKAFQFGKELGFNYLELKERGNASSLLRIRTFDEVLSHYKASYFSVALFINRDSFVNDLRQFFGKKRWEGEAFLGLMHKYGAFPAMLFQRLTNVLPRFFGLSRLFFMRLTHHTEEQCFHVDKELHLATNHFPQGNRINEHYKRRWLSISLLQDLQNMQKEGKYVDTIVGVQRSRYLETEVEYLCFTLARIAYPTPNININLTLGVAINDELRDTIKFLDDPSIRTVIIDESYKGIPIRDCSERAVPTHVTERKEQRRRMYDALKKLIE